MNPFETAGIVALAIVVVREAFALIRRRNHNPGHEFHELRDDFRRELDALINRVNLISTHVHDLVSEVTALKAQVEILLHGKLW